MSEDEKRLVFTQSFNGGAYERHLIGFIDILGYSEIMLGDNQELKQQVLELQHKLVTWELKGEEQVFLSNNGSETAIRSLTAILSDTMVFSIPWSAIDAQDSKLPKNLLFRVHKNRFPNHIVAILADSQIELLKIGLLSRGSIIIGDIFHNDKNIIFGEGLAKASYNEKCIAKSPRVIVEQEVQRLMETTGGLKIDKDGQFYIDYIDILFQFSCGNQNATDITKLTSYLEFFRNNITSNIASMENAYNKAADELKKSTIGSRLQKWIWTRDYYNNSITHLKKNVPLEKISFA